MNLLLSIVPLKGDTAMDSGLATVVVVVVVISCVQLYALHCDHCTPSP